MIVRAAVSEEKILTDIALKSKAFWGYSNELMQGWKEDLKVTTSMLERCTVFKFVVKNKVTGFYVLNPPQKNSIVLEMLFILPDFIGKGIGSELLQHAFKKALKINTNLMRVLSDPNAIDFYLSKGFCKVGEKESVIAGRFLPILEKQLC